MSLERKVSIEAIVDGAVVRAEYEGCLAADAVADLKEQGAVFRTSFPSYGKGGGNWNKDTKSATATMIQVEGGKGKAYVKIVCQSGDEAVTVAVSSKKIDSFLGDIKAVDALDDSKLAQLTKAVEGKVTDTIMLSESNRFTVNYWTGDENKSYTDSFAKLEAVA